MHHLFGHSVNDHDPESIAHAIAVKATILKLHEDVTTDFESVSACSCKVNIGPVNLTFCPEKS